MGTDADTKVKDIDLIQEYLRTKDARHFTTLYRKYSGKVYGKCLSLLREEHLAKDATQDIFMKIFLNLNQFGAQSKFSTWVYSITYNYCIDQIRKKKKMSNLFSDEMEKAAQEAAAQQEADHSFDQKGRADAQEAEEPEEKRIMSIWALQAMQKAREREFIL